MTMQPLKYKSPQSSALTPRRQQFSRVSFDTTAHKKAHPKRAASRQHNLSNFSMEEDSYIIEENYMDDSMLFGHFNLKPPPYPQKTKRTLYFK